MSFQISELESDLIREIVNIGMAKAADSLSVIARESVLISIPTIQVLESDKIGNIISEYKFTYTIVESEITGDLEGKSLILLTADHTAHFCTICLTDDYLRSGRREEMQVSLLLEISNILTGAILTQISNIFKLNVYSTPPKYISEGVPQYLREAISDFPRHQPIVFLVKTEFMHSKKPMQLPLIVIFSHDSLSKMLHVIRSYDHGMHSFLN